MSFPTAGTQNGQVKWPCQKFQGLTDWVNDVIHLPGGKRIAACSKDGSLRVWNLENGVQISNGWWDSEDEVSHITLSPDGKKIISITNIGVVSLWDIDSGKVITKWNDTGYPMCWSQDGERILGRLFDGTAKVWDVESGKVNLEINTGHRYMTIYTGGAIYSPDETMIATAGDNMEKEFLKIWDAKTGEFVKNLKGHTEQVTCLAWTHDTSTLISGSNDCSIRTWNTTTWQQIAILTEHTNLVVAIAISPNGRILASASYDGTARLWNIENGHFVSSPLQHSIAVNCLSFSTDGKLLATGCWNGDVYTWDVSAIEDGLDNLLDRDKTILNDVATQRRNQRRENAHRIPPRFFDDSTHHPHSHGSHRTHLSPAAQHYAPGPTLLSRVSLLFRHTRDNAQSTGAGLRPIAWVRNHLSRMPRRQHDEGNQLQESRPAVVDVPFTRGRRRNVSGAEIRLEREKARIAQEKKRKKISAGGSRPPQINVTQQSSGAAQTQTTSQLSSSSIIPAVATASTSVTSTSPRPVGRWTRFRLYICCLSGQYTDGHE